MKTITHTASTSLLGVFMLLGLVCTPFLPFNFDALGDLFGACKNQWHCLTDWMSGGMMQPHR